MDHDSAHLGKSLYKIDVKEDFVDVNYNVEGLEIPKKKSGPAEIQTQYLLQCRHIYHGDAGTSGAEDKLHNCTAGPYADLRQGLCHRLKCLRVDGSLVYTAEELLFNILMTRRTSLLPI